MRRREPAEREVQAAAGQIDVMSLSEIDAVPALLQSRIERSPYGVSIPRNRPLVVPRRVVAR